MLSETQIEPIPFGPEMRLYLLNVFHTVRVRYSLSYDLTKYLKRRPVCEGIQLQFIRLKYEYYCVTIVIINC